MPEVYDYAAIRKRMAELEAAPSSPAPQQPPPPKIIRVKAVHYVLDEPGFVMRAIRDIMN